MFRLVARSQNERLNYAALGDSSSVGIGAEGTAGYPDRLARWLVEQQFRVGLLNLAMSGATTATVRVQQVATAERRMPDLVTLGIGTNDLWRMVPLDLFRTDLDWIGERIAKTGARVVITNIADLSLAPVGRMIESFLSIPPALFQQRLDAMNEIIASVSRRYGFEHVDLCTLSRNELPNHPEYFCEDGFHPSNLGYERWTEAMKPAVMRAAHAWRTARGTRGSEGSSPRR